MINKAVASVRKGGLTLAINLSRSFTILSTASTNWRLKLYFYSISDNKYNTEFLLFFEENKKREEKIIPKNGRFPAKTGGFD